MILNRTLGQKPFETLSRVARYYMDNGMTQSETRKRLDIFLIECMPFASIPLWSETMDRALKRAIKNPAIHIENINITKSEMDTIDKLDGRQLRRLAFTLLCLSKYWNQVNDTGDFWVNSKDSDIMHMANIKTSVKRQSLMYNQLNSLGLIRFSKRVDNTNVKVCFASDGAVALSITDFRNLGYQYLLYHGEPYFKCFNCGITIKYDNPKSKSSSGHQKYCKTCAAEIAVKQRVNSVMRRRGQRLSQ